MCMGGGREEADRDRERDRQRQREIEMFLYMGVLPVETEGDNECSILLLFSFFLETRSLIEPGAHWF